MVGACDVTLLPAGGEKRSREGLVADIPAQLSPPRRPFPLPHRHGRSRVHAPPRRRARASGPHGGHRAEDASATELRGAPRGQVQRRGEGLYASVGFEVVADVRDGGGGGEGAGREDAGLMASFPLAFPSGGLLGIGRKAASRNEVLMVKRLPDVQGDGDGDVAGDGDGDGDGDGAQ